MIRKHIHIGDKQLSELIEVSNKTGLSIAEIIRRAIDEYLKTVRIK